MRPPRLPALPAPRRSSLTLCLVLALGPLQARADDVLVAVAANFASPLARIAAGFSAATGHVVKASAGPTGRFYTQVVAGGAPFEVLVAADTETPTRLIAGGHAVAGSRYTYAIGQLVLWSAQPGLVDAQGQVLAEPQRFGKLAIANPRTAPYGVAALQVLQARGLSETLKPRLVTGESVGQAHQFVVSGNAELGFVALSQVAAPGRPTTGSMWRVPQALYHEIRQDAVLLRAGRGRPAALALLAYLKSEPARSLIAAYGYALPAP